MKLPDVPYIRGIASSRQAAFGGLNHNLGARDGELWDMENLTSDLYPLLSPRKPRYQIGTLTAPNGLYHSDALYAVDGKKLYRDGTQVATLTTEGEKTLIGMGGRLLIFPDKLIYSQTDGLKSLESSATSVSCTIQDGSYAGEEAEANTIYAASVSWGSYFKAGDAVTISGASTHTDNNKTAIVREIDGHYLRFYENTFTISSGGDSETLTLKREVPDLDYLCTNENRVWGCKGDTIWCSKLGDPFNWYVFDGIASDAWSVESGTAGEFTACTSFLGYPIFFKEDRIFKVYGSKPSNYELMSSATLGVADGSAKSLAVAAETLFYLARTGIVAYSGGVPQSIAEPFGGLRFTNAVGGSDGSKYYVSMHDEAANEYALYVYDTQRGLWHREDDTEASFFAYDGGLHCLTADGDHLLIGSPTTVPNGATEETDVSWIAEFSDFTMDSFDGKYPTRLRLRVSGEEGATFTSLIQYDSSGTWESVATVTLADDTKQAAYLSTPIRRCDHFRLKLSGTGAGRVHAYELEFYDGKNPRK